MGVELGVGKIIHFTTFHPFEQAFHLSERFVIRLDEYYQSVFEKMIIAMAHRIWSVWCRALKCLIHYTLIKGFQCSVSSDCYLLFVGVFVFLLRLSAIPILFMC